MQTADKYLSYFRYYRFENLSLDFSWWFCFSDNNVYKTSEIYDIFGFSSKEEIYASNIFVEFYKVDIINLKKDYLRTTIGKDYKKWSCLEDEEFDIKFNRYIDANNLIRNWYEFEKAILLSTFIKWRKEKGITVI